MLKRKKIKLGKNNIFYVNAYGMCLEDGINQFCLKVENKEVYNKIGVNGRYKSLYDIYIKPELITNPNKGYSYIQYDGEILDFEKAYKKALEISEDILNKLNKNINIFCYKERCYFLSRKYLNPLNRGAFRSIENNVLERKYTYGSKHKTKKGLEQSQKITQAILIKMGQ